MSDYTERPTRVRLTQDGNETILDGVDDNLVYTEAVWSFDTFAEAVAAIPDFIQNTQEDGVVWVWHPDRPHKARHTTWTRRARCTRCIEKGDAV